VRYSGPVLYRLYQPDDFAVLYDLEERCFHPPHRFSRATMRRLIGQPHAATWIAEDNAQMCGFAIVEWTLDSAPPSAYIQTIEVMAEARGQGVGEELLRQMEGSARTTGQPSSGSTSTPAMSRPSGSTSVAVTSPTAAAQTTTAAAPTL